MNGQELFKKLENLSQKYINFKKKEYGDYILFSYTFVDPTIYEKHPEAIEIRGITFHKETKDIVSRPFPKFFNFGEKMCTVSADDYGIANEKYDGSLIQVSKYNDDLIVGTKGSLDPESQFIKESRKIIENSNNIKELINDYEEYTILFELIGPDFRIVLPYKENKLVLIGLRHKKTGKLVGPEELMEIAKHYDLDVAEIKYKGKIKDIQEQVRPLENIEGVVAYTENGICKIKTEWYLKNHQIFKLGKKKIIQMYLNNELDDYYPYFTDLTKEYVDKVIQKLNNEALSVKRQVEKFFETYKPKDKKELAMILKEKKVGKIAFIFYKYFEGKDLNELVLEYLKRKYC